MAVKTGIRASVEMVITVTFLLLFNEVVSKRLSESLVHCHTRRVMLMLPMSDTYIVASKRLEGHDFVLFLALFLNINQITIIYISSFRWLPLVPIRLWKGHGWHVERI